MTLSSVDLPMPDSPRIATYSPARTSSEIWFRTLRPPKRLPTATSLSTAETKSCLSRSLQRNNFAFNALARFPLRDFEVVARLEVHPELCFHTKEARQAQRRVCAQGAASAADFIDPALRYAGT